MKNKKFRAILLSVFFAVCLRTHFGADGEITPYNLGETLTYEAKFSKSIIKGIAVADLKFSVGSAPNGISDYLIKSEAKSKGTLAKLFRFSFLQEMESTD